MSNSSLEERYEGLKERLGYYLLLQVYTFLHTSDGNDLSSAMKSLTDKASEINVREAKQLPELKYPEALGSSLAKHMGEAFDSKYEVENGKNNYKVILEECGCIDCIQKESDEFGLDDATCRTIFCGACLGGYRMSAEKLGIKFDGSLSTEGCSMTFRSS